MAAALLPGTLLAQAVVEEVHVTGVPINQSPDELAQSVTILREETLDRVRNTNLGETLAGQLGISASYFGAGASRPIIRGLAGPRVRTLEDGIDSMDVSTVSDDHAVSIDPLIAEQIEIFRGPTTLLYGSGAVGGVVNTVTNRIPEFPAEKALQGAFELRGDTVADDRTAAVALDGGARSFAWHFDGLSRDSSDYEIPRDPSIGEARDHVANSDLEVESFAAGASWVGADGFFGVAVSNFDSNYGLPGHHAEEEPPVRIDLGQTRVDLKGGWAGFEGGLQAINLRIGINDYEHVELEGHEVGTRFENDAYEARLELMHSPWGRWNGAVGLQFAEREFAAIGEEAFVPPVDTRTLGLFMIEQRELERWQLSLGARLEVLEHEPSSAQPVFDDTAASVSVAAIRELGRGYALAFNLAQSERLPVAEELYSNGPHLSTGNVEMGDASIGAETSRHLDIGLRKTEGDLTWTITAFVTDYDDFIYLRDTGLEDPVHALPIFRFAQQDAELRGLEAEVFTPLTEVGVGELDLRVFADFVEGELDSGMDLPRMPPRRLGARLQYHDERLIVGLEASYYDDQDKIAAFETPTEGYTMVSADLNWSLGRESAAQFEVFVRATNLLDELARRHTSFLKDTLPLPGRNYSAGFRARF